MRNNVKHISILLIINLLFSLSCSSRRTFRLPDEMPDDTRHIFPPEEKNISLYKEIVDVMVLLPIDHIFDFSRHLRKLAGKPKQALNVDAYDEVQNSSWFTNRNEAKKMSIDEIIQGSDTGEGPNLSGLWTITRAKLQGVMPGFQIKDSEGIEYLIKFAPPGYSELPSGAELVSAKLFYAAGYNVPEYYIVYFRPEILRMGDNVKFTDKNGQNRIMTPDDLDEMLEKVEILPNGTIRAVASKFLEGKIIGPFRFEGTRKDDPNDIIPHEHRRELRGFGVICAWLNNSDPKAQNTLDTYVVENGKGYVKHYILDFGVTLGSGGHGPTPPFIGFEYHIEPTAFFKQLLSLGLYVPPYEKYDGVEDPAVGLYKSENFNPGKYKTQFPHPAFDNMTNRDGFWGAKIVMSFTDEQLEAAVGQGKYTNPDAADVLLNTIIERRDIIGRYWFERMNPLDKFRIQAVADKKQELHFVDLAIETGLEQAGKSSYKYSLTNTDIGVVVDMGVQYDNSIPLPDIHTLMESKKGSTHEEINDTVWELKIHTRRGEGDKWSKWVKVFFSIDDKSGNYVFLGNQCQE
ncbi:hypothetical protein ACFL2X_04120 [Candidatus Latescibacterota bacterium]